ncbi:hypothetical protein GCM10010442_25510 [Kitasatospora kifunensis]
MPSEYLADPEAAGRPWHCSRSATAGQPSHVCPRQEQQNMAGRSGRLVIRRVIALRH